MSEGYEVPLSYRGDRLVQAKIVHSEELDDDKSNQLKKGSKRHIIMSKSSIKGKSNSRVDVDIFFVERSAAS